MNGTKALPCSDSQCSCFCAPAGERFNRRDFLKLCGLGAGAASLHPWQAMAGPFTREDFRKLVPLDKKLRPEWVRSLTERGERAVYRGADLEKIGMPIGGLCAGQVYLGGDGTLWHWDIFNRHIPTGAEHYAKPLTPSAPFDQGFALRVVTEDGTTDRVLDRSHWPGVSFTGEYPIGYVQYRDPDLPVAIDLEAFSPFIPLNTEDSSLPATILEFSIRNTRRQSIECELAGWLENAVCLHSADQRDGLRRNRVLRQDGLLLLECSAEEAPARQASTRADIVFDDFERDNLGDWTAEGAAFGQGPVELIKVPSYQGDLGARGERAINSHASAPGETVEQRDSAKGTLTSRSFTIERDYITFLVGGGAHRGKTCIQLRVGERVVLSATGRDNNRMQPVSWDVRRWTGSSAQIQIIDAESGPWGNVGVDDIIFSDNPRTPLGNLSEQPDFGTMCLALLDPGPQDFANPSLHDKTVLPGVFSSSSAAPAQPVRRRFWQSFTGSLARTFKLAPDQTQKITFLLCWHFPNLDLQRGLRGRHYATRFDSALAVAEYVRAQFDRLSTQTRLWHDTWYDSTLPRWFLDRTFLNTSILATSTCYRLSNGRFYAWEGVGCCEGTCGHVWQYAHAPARLFPELERSVREMADFGVSLQPDGAIHFRGEFNDIPAIDAQAGTILRALREHQHSAADAFLKRNWPQIKLATQWLIRKDANADGIIESNQHNTLDTDWFGPVAWLSGIYLSSLLAAETMANEIGDTAFASQCREIFERGRERLVSDLFNGEYFINQPDPAHLDAINSGTGCHIDQVLGQSWAFHVGLPRVLPEQETLSALKSLWSYNFTPDVGPYRENYKPGRWYAMPGEAGLLMCTFPQADWDYAQAKGKGADWAAGYFNECMNGFEYQVAGHMIWEGLLTEGLAITRAIHDRYHPSRRNPWNEVECGDHYARSMASYGVFLAICGYGYHGPKGILRFAPRLRPENFKCAFTTAEGWGTYSQSAGDQRRCLLHLRYGKLQLRQLELGIPSISSGSVLAIRLNGQPAQANITVADNLVRISFSTPLTLTANDQLELSFA